MTVEGYNPVLICLSHVSIPYSSQYEAFNPLTISITYPVIILPEYDDREDRQSFKKSKNVTVHNKISRKI